MIIAGISGSLRKGSYNTNALNVILDELKNLGAEIDLINLKELALPVYDQDIEDSGSPSNVVELRKRLKRADGFVIVTPEYNHSIPGSLKNAIDWASRGGQNVFKGKFIALAGASTGMGGTIRAQIALLPVFRALGGIVLTKQVHISLAKTAFNENGKLTDEKIHDNLKTLAIELYEKLIDQH